MSRGTRMLRFDSEADLHAAMQRRREDFNGGARGRVVVPERDVLAAAIELLRKHPAIAFAYRQNTRSGYVLKHGVYDRLVTAGHIKRDEAQFMRFNFKGAADITGMLRNGRRVEIECKADGGGSPVSDEQCAFLEAVNGGGGLGFVARSVDDVM